MHRTLATSVPAIVMVCLTGIFAESAGQADLLAQNPAAGQENGKAASSATPGRMFGSDAGLILNFIKPDKAADFEAVVAKLKEALNRSDKPQRKQQAAGWKVYRAVEPGANGSILYLFKMDPVVHGADYAVATILAEAFPANVQDLYKQYSESYASGQNIVNLSVVTDLGQPLVP